MAGPQAQQPISQTEGASASRALRPLSSSAPSSSSSALHIPSNNVLEHIEIEVEDDHQRIGDGDGIESCSGSIKRYTVGQRSANRGGGTETASRKNNEDGNSTRGGTNGTNGGGDGGDSTNDDDDNDDDQSKKRVRHRHRRPLYRRFFSYIKTAWTGVNFSSPTDSELEELETPPRYRPDSIRALCRVTRFTEAEIKRIYRGFKAECPTGVVKEETFKIIYAQFFPQGANTGLYAHYVFNTLDQDRSGIVSFEEFVQGLSILSRGSVEEKLRWTFSLYDINGDGFITRDEMTDIVTAIYELVGRHPDSVGPEISKINNKVDTIFQKMDRNCDGVVTLEEFLTCCHNDDAISRSMAVFDTSF